MAEVKPKEKCPGCGREALKKPVAVCPTCHREVVEKKFGSRSKGNKFEAELAKTLSAWWGEEKAFRRTPLSGAWDKRAGGDLVAPEGFPFTVEAKHREDWELHHPLLKRREGEVCVLDQIWLQALRETSKGKRPLLLFTKNRWPTFYMMAYDDWVAVSPSISSTKVTFFMDGDVVRVVGLLEDLLKEWRPPR